METLSKECYAYPDKELYPIHTKQASLESFKEFQSDVHKYSKDRIELIGQNFIKAASLHGIKYNAPQQEQPRDTISFQTQGGQLKITKIASASDVSQALTAMESLREDVSLKDLRKVAQYILKECEKGDLQVQNETSLYKYAGFGFGDPQEMAQEFSKRGSLINMPAKCSSDFYALYRSMKQDKNEDLFTKSAAMCDMLDGIDRMYKLAGYYGGILKRPEQACFSQGIDQVIKQYQDYLKVDSTNTVLSKQALLQNREQVDAFFDSHYGCKLSSNQEMFTKVASLSATGLKALIQDLK